jgi:hypothetical protein
MRIGKIGDIQNIDAVLAGRPVPAAVPVCVPLASFFKDCIIFQR